MELYPVPPAIREIGTVLKDETGHSIRMVGGAVRDIVRNETPKDHDICTDARPETIVEVFERRGYRVIPTGLQHGTVTVMVADTPYEITTLRIDVDTDGRHAIVEFTADWEVDAARRDFTMNAMSIDMDGRLHDYFNGQEHLKRSSVVFVGDAEARIREDYLRILRYYRFRARLGATNLTPDTDYRKIFRDTATGLQQISGERIWSELSKILSTDRSGTLLAEMGQTRILEEIGIRARVTVAGFDTVQAVTRNPITLLAALIDSEQAIAVDARYHFSTPERKLLFWLCKHNEVDVQPNIHMFRRIVANPREGRAYAWELLALTDQFKIHLDVLRIPDLTFPITGQDLLNLGFKQGKILGTIMADLRTLWFANECKLNRDDLLLLARRKIPS